MLQTIQSVNDIMPLWRESSTWDTDALIQTSPPPPPPLGGSMFCRESWGDNSTVSYNPSRRECDISRCPVAPSSIFSTRVGGTRVTRRLGSRRNANLVEEHQSVRPTAFPGFTRSRSRMTPLVVPLVPFFSHSSLNTVR
jgi:hypothetical protein